MLMSLTFYWVNHGFFTVCPKQFDCRWILVEKRQTTAYNDSHLAFVLEQVTAQGN